MKCPCPMEASTKVKTFSHRVRSTRSILGMAMREKADCVNWRALISESRKILNLFNWIINSFFLIFSLSITKKCRSYLNRCDIFLKKIETIKWL